MFFKRLDNVIFCKTRLDNVIFFKIILDNVFFIGDWIILLKISF